jgi:putative nucleotidyltransferase with HDIG domain
VQRFGATSLVVFVLLGVAMGFLLSNQIETTALASARQNAYDTLHDRLLANIHPADLQHPMSQSRYATFSRFVWEQVLSRRTVRVKIWNQWGVVTYSNDPKELGKKFEIEEGLAAALHGRVASDVSSLTKSENVGERRFGRLLEVYLPIRFRTNGPVVGAFEVYQLYGPIGSQIAGMQRRVFVLLGAGLIVLYVLLFGIVRSGSNLIKTQQQRLQRYTTELEHSYRQTILSLAAAVDARDHSTERHSVRVAELAVLLGGELGFPADALRDLERGALLHDIGKIGVRDAILWKPGKLTEDEWVEMRRHPEIGYQMLRDIEFLQAALPVVRHHHERWDGTGYPARLEGEDIPLWARMFAIIDAYDALTSDRPYRSASSHEEAMERIWADAGKHFDPALVQAFDHLMADRTPTTTAAVAPAPVRAS